MPVTDMEKATQDVLAMAWSLFNRPLWEARNEMQFFLEDLFELKKKTPIDLSSTPVKVGDLVTVNGEECLVVRKRDQRG